MNDVLKWQNEKSILTTSDVFGMMSLSKKRPQTHEYRKVREVKEDALISLLALKRRSGCFLPKSNPLKENKDVFSKERGYLREKELGDKVGVEPSNKVSIDDLETMCRALYAYRFGTINFLDMLALWENVLGIKPPQTNK